MRKVTQRMIKQDTPDAAHNNAEALAVPNSPVRPVTRRKRGCGVHLSKANVAFARLRASATSSPGRHDESAYHLYALNVLEHLTQDDLVAILAQSKRFCSVIEHDGT